MSTKMPPVCARARINDFHHLLTQTAPSKLAAQERVMFVVVVVSAITYTCQAHLTYALILIIMVVSVCVWPARAAYFRVVL